MSEEKIKIADGSFVGAGDVVIDVTYRAMNERRVIGLWEHHSYRELYIQCEHMRGLALNVRALDCFTNRRLALERMIEHLRRQIKAHERQLAIKQGKIEAFESEISAIAKAESPANNAGEREEK